MERSTTPMIDHPDHEQGSNSAAAAAAASTQSGRSSVKNSSLSVVLGSIPLPRIEARECKHFGIRQYVVGMREKDRNICFPFDSDGDSENFLPPMAVPKYKYWLCQNCLYGNGAVSRLEDVLLISDCHKCQPITNNEIEIAENGSADSSFDHAIELSLATDKNDKCTEVAQMIEIDQENVDKGESKEVTDDQVAVNSKSIVLVDNGLAGSSGSNKPTTAVNGQLVKHSSIQIEDERSEDSDRPRKKKERLVEDCMRQKGNSDNSRWGTEGSPSKSKGNYLENILGVRIPTRKRKMCNGQEKKPMEKNRPSNQSKITGTSKENTDIGNKAIVISSDSDSDSDSEGRVDGVGAYNSKESGRERSSLGSGKPAQLDGSKKTKVPWKEVIGKNNHTEIIGGKDYNSDAGTSSSKSKQDSTTSRGIEPKRRGCMPPRQQSGQKSNLTKKRKGIVHIQESPIKRKGSEGRKLQLESDNHADIPLDHGKAGRATSSIPTGEFTRKNNFFAGESSVSHKFTAGPYLDATLKNVTDKFARSYAKQHEQRNYSPLPSNKNIPLIQDLDFSDKRADNVANGKGMMPLMLREFSSTSARQSPSSTTTINMNLNSGPTKTNRQDWPNTLRNFFNDGPTKNPFLSNIDAFSKSKSQPKVSSGGVFSELGTVRNMSAQTNMQYAEPFNRFNNGLPLPFGNSVHQRGENESSNPRMYAGDEEKRMPNLDLNIVDLNSGSQEEHNRNVGTESFKKAPAEYQFFPKKTGMELNPKCSAPLDDSYSNMQLLSLMDSGMQSNKPFSLDGENSACSRIRKPELVEKELFPKSAPKSGPSESLSSLNTTHVRNSVPWEYSPVIPTLHQHSSLFRNAENARRTPPVQCKVFGRVLEQGKSKGPYEPADDLGRRLEKSSASPSDGVNRLGDLVPSKDKHKGILGGVDSLIFPSQRQNKGPQTDVCSINRNPADFSYPDAENEYMIDGEELKVGNKVLSRGKTVRRKQRAKKNTPANERAQHRPT